jgi:hypothetical protein
MRKPRNFNLARKSRELKALLLRSLLGFDPAILYKRDANSTTVYARDEGGHTRAFTVTQKGVRPLPFQSIPLAKTFGRVDFGNRRRFTAHVRSDDELKTAFDAVTRRKTTGVVELPSSCSRSKRAANQGMRDEMTRLTGATKSASEYAVYLREQTTNTVAAGDYEWGHLLAHSLHGRDEPDNIVAVAAGNNTEQLAIESALHFYRNESLFTVLVQASVMDGAGEHMADVICYSIRCSKSDDPLELYLDAQHAPEVSSIHFWDRRSGVVKWLNGQVERHQPEASSSESQQVMEYVRTLQKRAKGI